MQTIASTGVLFYGTDKTLQRADASKKEQVAHMFDQISGRYDLLNHLFSFGIDKGWRRRLLREARQMAPKRILDIATGKVMWPYMKK